MHKITTTIGLTSIIAGFGLMLIPTTASAANPPGLTVDQFRPQSSGANGDLKVSLSANAPGPATVSYLAYKLTDYPNKFPQTLVDSSTKTLQPGQTATLHVLTPSCGQIDAIEGSSFPSTLEGNGLSLLRTTGGRTTGWLFTGGCTVPEPTPTPTEPEETPTPTPTPEETTASPTPTPEQPTASPTPTVEESTTPTPSLTPETTPSDTSSPSSPVIVPPVPTSPVETPTQNTPVSTNSFVVIPSISEPAQTPEATPSLSVGPSTEATPVPSTNPTISEGPGADDSVLSPASKPTKHKSTIQERHQRVVADTGVSKLPKTGPINPQVAGIGFIMLGAGVLIRTRFA